MSLSPVDSFNKLRLLEDMNAIYRAMLQDPQIQKVIEANSYLRKQKAIADDLRASIKKIEGEK